MRIHHVAIEVSDLERSLAFYQSILGFQVERRLNLPGEEIIFLKSGNDRIELVHSGSPGPGSQNIHIAFEVEDFPAILSRLQEENIPIIEGPYWFENGWRSIFALGPDGEVLEFLSVV